MRFLPFTPKVSPTAFGFLWAFLQDCPLTRWLPGHYLCLECACCTTPCSRKKLYLVFSFPYLSCLTRMDKGSSFSLYLPLWHASGGPSPSLTSFGPNLIPAMHFPKRGLNRNPKIPFSPLHQTTPSKSLGCGPTFPVLARYKWVVLRPLCVCSIILCICLLLLPCHFCRSCYVSFCYVSFVFVLILHDMKGRGLYYFFLFPHGLGYWLGKSPCLSGLLGLCSCYFSSC